MADRIDKGIENKGILLMTLEQWRTGLTKALKTKAHCTVYICIHMHVAVVYWNVLPFMLVRFDIYCTCQ